MPTLSIRGIQVPRLLHQGRRILPISFVDRIHGLPSGTAYRAFNDSRASYARGTDYEIFPYARKLDLRGYGIEVNPSGLASLFALGYRKLSLALSLDEELVQEVLSKVFDEGNVSKELEMEFPAVVERFRALVALHREYGLGFRESLQAAQRVIQRDFGIDIADYLDREAIIAESGRPLVLSATAIGTFYSATELGRLLSPKQRSVWVNRRLEAMGFHQNISNNHLATWVLTEAGKQYGITTDLHQDGSNLPVIRWSEKVIPMLQKAIEQEKSGADLAP